ncbi:MAG: M48 family metallopeptidase [Crocinitomicaceae bacterium]|nr:M48 family metallopeptidase [Crocinitomicaceae bacterium]
MKLTLLVGLFVTFSTFAQVDFNTYTTLLSKGRIPTDFTTQTYDKLEKDLRAGNKELSRHQEKVFFEGVNYAIDDLLHSGYVTYGDEISAYLEKIADKLLKKDKKLRNELRFYTLKSNSTNAFSTDQGIVFVTTGLISQVTSEAQIAYILAHEISHYTENHVLETFSHKSKNRRQTIEQMSVYAKEKEFDADQLGLRLYKNAGYSKDEVLPTFDVLMYSYLPFDEIEIPLNYFSSNDSTYLPGRLFPEEKFEIKALEDEDDSRSSHPNIKKRKEAVLQEFKSFSNWGSDINKLGDEQFEYIRNIARFESVRNDVIDANYGDALYGIFLMERTFPESIYLKRMKAQTWLGLLMYRLENKISRTIDRKSEYEGESASVHYMIRKMSKDELEAMALRQIFDLLTENENDDELQLIWDKAVKATVFGENFELSSFSKMSYYNAKNAFHLAAVDTLSVVEKIDTTPKSKYDRIKKKRDVEEPENFDSTTFHIYLIPDLLINDLFNTPYDKYKDEARKKEKEKDEYEALTYSQQKKVDRQKEKDRLKLGIEELIVVEPTVLSYKGSGVDRVKSEKLEERFSEVIDEMSASSGIKIYPINHATMQTQGTIGYNERSTLLNMITQISTNDDIEAFPVDYQLLKEIETNYGTTNVMFSVVEHNYSPEINISAIYLSVVLYPVGLIYLPLTLLSGNNTEINMVILDISEAKIVAGSSHYIKDNARKHTVGAHVYSIFSQLSTSK